MKCLSPDGGASPRPGPHLALYAFPLTAGGYSARAVDSSHWNWYQFGAVKSF